ncbi:MAG: outer membrane beta-barrel protein [Rhizobiaceae bacterium]|nr:outer membrane beta-barrel protein [Rhizobiaceae bacterium]
MPDEATTRWPGRARELLSLTLLALVFVCPPSVAQELRGSIEDQADLPVPVEQSALPQPSQADTSRIQPNAAAQPQQRTTRVQSIGTTSNDQRGTDQDPFAPVGIRAGSFILRPSVETGILATTNATSSPAGDDAIISQSTLRLNAVSDWSVDQLELDAFVTLERSLSGEELNQKEAGISVAATRELANDYQLRATAAYAVSPESFASPVEIAGAMNQPLQQSLTGSLYLTREAGKLRLGIGADVDREWYGNAELANGSEISQSDRDNTLTTARLRLGYELSPALVPFAELRAGRRIYDNDFDAAGYRRSGDLIAANAGLAFDRGEKFWGELALGYVQQEFDDDRLVPIDGMNVIANINWSPVRGTNVNFFGSTEVEGTTTPGLSGSLLHSGTLTIERQMRANLTGSIAGGIAYRDFQPGSEHEVIYSAEASVTWWINRYLGVTGRLRHENVNSTLPDRDASTNSAFLGLKAQR